MIVASGEYATVGLVNGQAGDLWGTIVATWELISTS